MARGLASAASERPNQLDRRVDAIPAAALLSQPAIALVDSARQEAARRRVDLMLPGWVLMVVFEAVALAYFWGSGAAARLRDRLRRQLHADWSVRFAFGAALALLARLAALLPAFYLYRVERIMDLTVELTRVWASFWIVHTLLAMVIAGIVATIVLWLVDRTHQWYAYTILIILAASIAWSYSSPFFEAPASGGVQAAGEDVQARVTETLARGKVPPVPVLVERARGSSQANAVVVGLGPYRKVIVPHWVAAADTTPEIVYAVAYEIGHVLH
ncbi:MAG: hypothetical protein JOZ01_01755, partial [Candidatus Eremiobacteraeota bacterium]|nr:hypothetical protein [Candidatus Eremiobacteraeota bacterium]